MDLSLDTLQPNTAIAEWADFVRSIRDARRFITGLEVRAIRWGIDAYGESAYAHLDSLGYESGTIANYLSIARRVAPELIEAGYSISMLGEVRALPQEEQVEVIREAQVQGWNRDELRLEVAHRAGRPPGTTTLTPALFSERNVVTQIKELWACLSTNAREQLLKELQI